MGTAVSLYGEQYDFPCQLSNPQYELMIATVPRSGSTMFSVDLWESGVLGSPLEYLNFNLVRNISRWKEKLDSPLKYWEELKRLRTSPNGVFSYKMFGTVYHQVANVSTELLSRIQPTHVVYLTREDLNSQAVSYSKAIQSGAWFADAPKRKPTKYSYDHVVECRALVQRQMDDWEAIFKMTETIPLRLSYEEITSNRAESIIRVVEYVTGSRGTQSISLPKMIVQRNEETNRWLEQLSNDESRLVDQPGIDSTVPEVVPPLVEAPPEVCVRNTHTRKGRGVFARRRYEKGELVEAAPVILLPDAAVPPALARMLFYWPMSDGHEGKQVHALALGYGSLYNHANPSNLRYENNTDLGVINYWAIKEVEAGEELTINYDASVGSYNAGDNSWFVRNGLLEL